ncbi:MAG TPA: hypothetical protein VKU00_29215, partial [Chthonomonadaceae bacterium]|nr:hypothetical protein [Chthonomonadaceae bacterium]
MTAKQSTQDQRSTQLHRRNESRSAFAPLLSRSLIALLVLPSCFGTSAAWAQSLLTGDGFAITGNAPSNASAKGLLNIGNKPISPTNAPGTPTNELLRGNGTGIGYNLQHGNVLPDTVRVRVNGTLLKLNRDYFLDADGGALYFATAVHLSDSVSVYYRYLSGADAPQKLAGVSGLQLSLGGSTQLGVAFDLSGAS